MFAPRPAISMQIANDSLLAGSLHGYGRSCGQWWVTGGKLRWAGGPLARLFVISFFLLSLFLCVLIYRGCLQRRLVLWASTGPLSIALPGEGGGGGARAAAAAARPRQSVASIFGDWEAHFWRCREWEPTVLFCCFGRCCCCCCCCRASSGSFFLRVFASALMTSNLRLNVPEDPRLDSRGTKPSLKVSIEKIGPILCFPMNTAPRI